GIAFVVGRKAVAFIEGNAQRRRMRLQEHIRNRHLSGKIGPGALMARVLVGANVIPWPTVECPIRYSCGVLERNVVPKTVTLVDDAPQRTRLWLHGHSGTVAQARGHHPAVAAVRIVGADLGAAFLRAP